MPNPNVAIFPSAVITDTNLPPGTDLYQSSLSAGVTNAQTTIPVLAVPANFPCIITIDNEEILIGSTVGLVLQVTTRGYNGTIAASHNNGTLVFGNVVSWHVNQAYAEIKAIETLIGPTGISVRPAELTSSAGTITGAINGVNTTFTFSPVLNPTIIRVYRSGIRMILTTDYTFTPGTNSFTFVAGQTPQIGDIIVVDAWV